MKSGRSIVGRSAPPVERTLFAAIVLALLAPSGQAQGEDPPPDPPQEPTQEETQEEAEEPTQEEAESAGESALESLAQDQEESDPIVLLEEAPALPADTIPIHGFLRARTVGRVADDDDNADVDLFATAVFDIGDPERHAVTAHIDAFLAWDLDDNEDGLFFSISDTYDNGFDPRLYEAYVDLNRIDGLDRLRLGRQQIWTTPVFVSFDGALVESQELGDSAVQGAVYAGVPVHQFESSSSGDFIGGAYVQARPWKNGRTRLDYMRLEDERVLGDSDNDLWTLGLWQGIRDGLDFEGEYSILDSESLDYRVALNAYDAESDWTLRLSHYELLETKGLLATEIDPYYASLLELFPYYQTTLLASVLAWEHLLLLTGFDFRRVVDSGDEGQFNRDFERYHVTSTLLDLGREGLDLSLVAEFWENDDSDIETWGVDLSSPLQKGWEGSIGSFYQLYKFDHLTGEERDHVRVYYIRLEQELTENLDFDIDYEFENSDFDDFHTLRIQLSWRF